MRLSWGRTNPHLEHICHDGSVLNRASGLNNKYAKENLSRSSGVIIITPLSTFTSLFAAIQKLTFSDRKWSRKRLISPFTRTLLVRNASSANYCLGEFPAPSFHPLTYMLPSFFPFPETGWVIIRAQLQLRRKSVSASDKKWLISIWFSTTPHTSLLGLSLPLFLSS